uniref:Uncharacterized protein n=1 Tax=Cercocebus atys TaxID=9531 RepID=A0A2K5KH48_CERAT
QAPGGGGPGGTPGSCGSGRHPSPVGSLAPGHAAVSSMQGKCKALKLNFANPPFISTAKFTLNPNPTGIQNPHWMKKNKNNFLWIWMK